MAGTIPLSMTQQFNQNGEPLSGGQLYIYQAGTVATPQNPYLDAGLSILMPNPITLDAAGRIPQFFLADGYIKIRLTDVNGIVQLAADGILVIGPSAGGGGGGGVDPTTIWATGDIKVRYDNAVINGFVRANGRTIGPSGSSATELAGPTAQALFNFLWNVDPNLTVFPSRGASSSADWAANRQLTLPDWRGRLIAGLGDMGNTDAARLTAAYFGATPTTLGAASSGVGGSDHATLAKANLPPYTPAGTLTSLSTIISGGTFGYNNNAISAPGGGPVTVGNSLIPIVATTTGNFTGTAAAGQTSAPFSIISPTMLATIYLKL